MPPSLAVKTSLHIETFRKKSKLWKKEEKIIELLTLAGFFFLKPHREELLQIRRHTTTPTRSHPTVGISAQLPRAGQTATA